MFGENSIRKKKNLDLSGIQNEREGEGEGKKEII